MNQQNKKEELKLEITRLSQIINAPEFLIPTFDFSKDFAYPHIEMQGEEYHFVVVERGQELERRRTFNIDEILFWIFDGITFEMACELELRNRKENEDFRIQLFQIQENLMYKINPKFSEILNIKHSKLLNK